MQSLQQRLKTELFIYYLLREHLMPFMGGSNTRITNPRWRTDATFKKIEKSRYFSNGSTDHH